MNKVYTIGRDTSCDIVITDSTDVVSRVHASLKAKGNGKYLLIDQSRNGTYVNGIRMSANEEIPVTRKDVISFAHVTDLDWNQIPKDKDPRMIWIVSAFAVVVVACVCFFIFKPENEPAQPPVVEEQELPSDTSGTPAVKDTTAKDTVYMKPKPVAQPKPKKEKAEGKKEEKPAKETPTKETPTKEEPEVVNPLL